MEWYLQWVCQAVLEWYLELKKKKKKNTEVDVICSDLETTKQEPKESFSTFNSFWRAKLAQIAKRPNGKEQLSMIVKNHFPMCHKQLYA